MSPFFTGLSVILFLFILAWIVLARIFGSRETAKQLPDLLPERAPSENKFPRNAWDSCGEMPKTLSTRPAIKRFYPPVIHHGVLDEGNFALSMAIGASTHSSALGYIVGGSLSGGLLGAEMNDLGNDSRDCSSSSPGPDSNDCAIP